MRTRVGKGDLAERHEDVHVADARGTHRTDDVGNLRVEDRDEAREVPLDLGDIDEVGGPKSRMRLRRSRVVDLDGQHRLALASREPGEGRRGKREAPG